MREKILNLLPLPESTLRVLLGEHPAHEVNAALVVLMRAGHVAFRENEGRLVLVRRRYSSEHRTNVPRRPNEQGEASHAA